MNAGHQSVPRDASGDRRFLVLACLVAYACGLALRLVELPLWSAPGLWIDGEPLMATHDAYAWLAGAKGVGAQVQSPMAWLVAALSSFFEIPLATVAFWVPAIVAPLVGVLTALLAWSLGCPGAALGAGMLGSIAPGFLLRTRLGYYDTDIVTLLLPLLVIWLLVHWLHPKLRGFLIGAQATGGAGIGWPFWAGLVVPFGGLWHPGMVDFAALLLVLAVPVGLGLGRPGYRAELAAGLAVYCMVGFGGWVGLVLGLGLCVCWHRGYAVLIPERWRFWVFLGLLGLAMLGLPQVRALPASLTHRAADYERSVEVSDSAGAIRYPVAIASVIEARSLNLGAIMTKLSWAQAASWAGVAGALVLMVARPCAMLLLPLLGAAFVGVLGVRASMFGGPVVALGLSVPLCWMAGPVRKRWYWKVVLPALVAALLLIPAWQACSMLRPTPVLSLPYARGLKKLGEMASDDAMVWIWWDWGYAAQYYANTPTTSDGARHWGRVLYPLARAFATPSPLQARQVMQEAALAQYRPWESYQNMSAQELNAYVEGLAQEDKGYGTVAPQYLVVSWEGLQLAHWVMYYGSWDVAAAKGRHGFFSPLGEFDFDSDRGIVRELGAQAQPVRSIDILDVRGLSRGQWTHPGAPRLVVHRPASQGALLDERTYESMMARLLLCPAGDPEIRAHFRLVYEGFPWVRVWALQSESLTP